MLSNSKFIRQSLELHLFFTRIMKEHSFFLQIGFVQRDSNLMVKADMFRAEFDRLLADVISLSNGVVSASVLESGEVVTPFTLKAEMVSAYLTGVNIPTSLTRAEQELRPWDLSNVIENTMLEERVCMINNRAMDLVKALVEFKTMLLSNILTCRLFTNNYPLLIEHILREAKFYYNLIQKLQNREEVILEREAYVEEVFWNEIMAEHSKFIRGLLDPTENDLINIANDFGNEFTELEAQSKEAMDKTIPISKVTNDSLKATIEISKFKAEATKGLIECKIKSIIMPLLGDHTLREANHYLRLLKIFEKGSMY